jgi:hypothetical protein
VALKNADWFWCALVVMPAWASVGSGWGLARRRCNRCDGVASLHSQSHRGPVPVHDRGLAAATKKKAPKNTQEHVHTPRRPQGAGQGRACPPPSRPSACKGTATWHTGAGTSSHTQHTRWRRRVDSTNNTTDRSSRKRLDPKTPKGRSHHPTACAQYLFGGSGQQGHRRDTRCGHSRAKHTQVRAWKGSGRTRGSLY